MTPMKNSLFAISVNFFAFLIPILSLSSTGLAFPELVRHGYPNCIACHVSPSGGGVLTDYGRSLSKELVSTWSYENEELVGHGLFGKTPDWLQLGGDLNFIQLYNDNDTAIQTRNFWMDNEIETAFHWGRFYLDSNLGIQRGPTGTPNLNNAISSHHYLGYFITDELSVRFGKFYPAYGLNLPNHAAVTRAQLGFDQGDEHLNIEAAYLGEKWDLFITGLLGKADLEGAAIESTDPAIDEHGAALSSSLWLLERFKLGLSFLYGSTDSYHRILSGFYGILKLSQKFYLLTEWDWQSKDDRLSHTEARGFVDYNEFGFEAYKGINLYIVQEEAYMDLNSVLTRDDSYGLGFKFYPRPHFEFQGEYRKERNMAAFMDYADTAFLMAHYYF